MGLRLLGFIVLLVAATAATVLHRHYARTLPVQLVVVGFAACGAAMGAGAALVRDFAVLPTSVFAAIVVPVVALIAAARTARRNR